MLLNREPRNSIQIFLNQVKQIRIPRPKYSGSSGTSGSLKMPREEPPRDYDLVDLTKNCRQETQKAQMDADDLQRAFQEKL